MRDAPLQKGESPLRICSLSKEEFQISKDAKFSPGIAILISARADSAVSVNLYFAGIQVSCPYLYCNSKNSQFQHAGRFPSGNNRICDVRQADEVYLEFVLNHLHSSHKHRRFNGDSLDMTMVVPQVDVEQNSNTIR